MQPPSYGPSMSRGRGQQGQLTQLPDGRWRARYREDGRQGKRPQATFATKREATEWLRSHVDETHQLHDGDTAVRVRRRERGRTVTQAIDDYLATVDVSPGRMIVLREGLRKLEKEFGPRLLQSLEPYELQAWRLTISAGYRSDVFAVAKQLLRQAHAWKWIRENPAADIKNPKPRRKEIVPIERATITALEDEIDQWFEGLPEFGAGTGMRPEEWIALEERDLDIPNRLIHIRRVYTTHGGLVELGPDGAKTPLQRRSIPMRLAVLAVLEERPRRIHTRLVWPSKRKNDGGTYHLNLTGFRNHFWHPAFTAAGLERQRIYDLRHTYATESIAAGVDLFTLSRRMGTSLQKIDETYGHLAGDSSVRELALLDAYDQAVNQ